MLQSKKTILNLVFGALFVALTITSAASAQRGSFGGQYSGVGDAAGAVLTLSQSGARVDGRLQVDGAMYVIEARVSGSEGYGVVGDPSSGATQPFRLRLNGGELIVALPQTAGSAGEVYRFQRGGRATAGVGHQNPYEGYPNQRGYQSPGATGGQLDPQLFGRWRRTNTMVSVGASFVSDQHLVVRPDGTYTLASGGAAGGNGSVSVSVGGGGGGGTTGRWRVRSNMVEISEGGPFQPYARYHIEGNTLMFTLADNSREIWERR